MKSYDYLVVGGGITGLTVTRILSLHGHRVLLVDKAPSLGGSIKRFCLGGVPFDIGFHFTGGLTPDKSGVLDDALALLGVSDRIRPIFCAHHASHRIVFSSQGVNYVLPSGTQAVAEQLKRDFGSQREGIDRYFARFLHVVANTPTLSVSGFSQQPPQLEEDLVTLQAVLDDCISDRLLQAILSSFCLCYGSRPKEISFATHSRICFAMQESLARVEDGGQAFVDALAEVIRRDGVEIRTGVALEACDQVKQRKAGRFLLSDGSEVGAGACIFTIHPRSILATLPKDCLSKAFQSRILDFEPSTAFFAVFGTLDGKTESPPWQITSMYPDLDLNSMLTCRTAGPIDGPVVVLRNIEQVSSRSVETISAFEVTFAQWTAAWTKSVAHQRPAEYYRYKQTRAQSILDRMDHCLPECRGRLKLLDTASNLTFRDFLNSPDGAAYGIRQKIGQFNIMGRLPIANLYAAGQSALLPGIVGAMTSAFLVCRGILGPERFEQFLAGEACC